MATASEITSGSEFSRTLEEKSISDSQTRVFRVLLDAPGEIIDIAATCGVTIGSPHPYNPGIYCFSGSARYEGDSRLVMICTFGYRSQSGSDGQDPQRDPPDARPPNWSTSTVTYEAPVRTWRKVTDGRPGKLIAAKNPVGDMYDGLSKLEPIMTISVEQFMTFDPLANSDSVGKINRDTLHIGSYDFPRATVLLHSINSSPVAEYWGDRLYRGWKASYEFLFKRNTCAVWDGSNETEVDIGWDIAVPQTGFNVKCFNPQAPGNDEDPYGQPLVHTSTHKIDTGNLRLPDTLGPGKKARAMVRVFAYDDGNGGVSQTPSAQPIPLNDAGHPMKESASPQVYVYRYRVYEEFTGTLGLRLQ